MKVFFLISPASRERQWATVRNVPAGVEALIPGGVAPLGSRATYAASISWKGRLKRFATIVLPLLNVTLRTDAPEDADIVYSWSKFPLRIRKPWVIELDNPYALTYYSRRSLLLLRPAVRFLLGRARHVSFMSEACEATFTEIFGTHPTRTSVQYPFVPAQPVRKRADGPLRFLFVALDFRMKGGPELVEAWKRAGLADAELHIVTAERHEASDVANIVFHQPASHERLLAEHFPKADVFVYPTLFDSFGVVLLEALSFGLGIIATDLYATPELVEDGVNGRLLTHPILPRRTVGNKQIVSPVEENLATFARKNLYPGAFYESLCAQLVVALQDAARDHAAWSESSRSLFERRFSPAVWRERFADTIAPRGTSKPRTNA